MPIQSGDVKLLKSAVMADVPEGGGAPTGNVVPDGVSNSIFPDLSELDRAGGRVNLRKVFPAVHTDDTDVYLGSNVLVAEPPQDPLVSVSLFAASNIFDTRTSAASRIESYLGRGSRLPGYLLENHVANQRSIQLFQRPGTTPPNIGRTLVLVLNEEQPNEQVQYVRVISVETETRVFTDISTNAITEYKADIVTLELSDALRYNWPGSPPSRGYTQAMGRTTIRDTIVADAGNYYGAARLALPAALGDSQVKAESVYTQLVPNARTETPTLDQRPAAQRLLTLATSPRLVEVAAAPHTMRVRVSQENRGFSWVQMLKPLPSPGSVIVSYMALGAWYTLQDDGLGNFTGAGVGTINYATGSMSITLPALPDSGSSIIINWGENAAYTNRAGQAGFRAPEFAWALPHQAIKPGTLTITWMSGGVLKTVTDNGAGALSGNGGVGDVDYAAGKVYLRPTAMLDAGGEFNTAYEYASTITQNFTGPAVDTGGFATLTLDQVPAARSVTVRWITTRNVSGSTGTSEIVSTTGTNNQTVSVNGSTDGGNFIRANTDYTSPGLQINFSAGSAENQPHGIYTWEVAAPSVPDPSVVFGAAIGSFEMLNQGVYSANSGTFTLTVDAACPDVYFTLKIKNPSGTVLAESISIRVGDPIDKVEPAFPPVVPEPTIKVPDDTSGVSKAVPQMFIGGSYIDDKGAVTTVYVQVDPVLQTVGVYAGSQTYDPPDMNRPVPVVWTEAEYLAQQKQMLSKAGVLTIYKIWGQPYV